MREPGTDWQGTLTRGPIRGSDLRTAWSRTPDTSNHPQLTAAAVSPNGNVIAVANEKGFHLIDRDGTPVPGFELDPDIITFYEGCNDSHRIHPMDFRQAAQGGSASSAWLDGAWRATTNRFVLARFVDEVSKAGTQVSASDALESLSNVSARTSRAFIQDLEEIRKLAEREDILPFIHLLYTSLFGSHVGGHALVERRHGRYDLRHPCI